MPNKMQLIITLRRDVTDRETGNAIYDLIKQRLADRPDITVTGHVTNHFAPDDQPAP